MSTSAFGVDHGISKGLSPKNMKTILNAANGEGIGNAPHAMRRMEYADMKHALRTTGKTASQDTGPQSTVHHLKGQLKYLSGNGGARRKTKSGAGPRGFLP